MERRIIDKPWGREEIWAETDRYVGKHLFINSGARLSRQYHERKDETIRVLKGTLVLEIGQGDKMERIFLSPGSSYHISPKTIHRFGADATSVVLVEVSTPELEDVVRLEDDYGRSDVGDKS